MKRAEWLKNKTLGSQPPSGGCVLKRQNVDARIRDRLQPPSGGCVLKPPDEPPVNFQTQPAAFGRLCVETRLPFKRSPSLVPAAFGRLCVETASAPTPASPICSQPPSGGCVLKLLGRPFPFFSVQPAAFGRLCVETCPPATWRTSPKPAAFGRLCVET